MEKTKNEYSAPALTAVTFAVEQGFAISNPANAITELVLDFDVSGSNHSDYTEDYNVVTGAADAPSNNFWNF